VGRGRGVGVGLAVAGDDPINAKIVIKAAMNKSKKTTVRKRRQTNLLFGSIVISNGRSTALSAFLAEPADEFQPFLLTEWQRIGNEINAAMIFARANFVNVLRTRFTHLRNPSITQRIARGSTNKTSQHTTSGSTQNETESPKVELRNELLTVESNNNWFLVATS
jgi:hypothetical protein